MASFITGLIAETKPITSITIGVGEVHGNFSTTKPVYGNGSITGKVLENGLPVSRRVMLYNRKTGSYAGQVRSDANGNYSFQKTNELLTYFIVSIDDNNDGVQYNLVGQDLISGNHDKRVAT